MSHIRPVSQEPRVSDTERRENHYRELTSRNHHFISPGAQEKLGQLRILVAGCGSTGGACIEPLARVGVRRFILADNGEYELTNLNRQHARIQDIGVNKAEFHRSEILAINPYAEVSIDRRGIHDDNVREFCDRADLVFDAVDVTTPAGMAAKISLHEHAKALRKPVLSALDLGFRQWGMSFDYRDPALRVFDGRLTAAKAAIHPIRALFEIYPPSSIPDHCLPLIIDLLEGRSGFASQLGCTSDMLSALIVPVILRFVEYGELVEGWSFDTYSLAVPPMEALATRLKAVALRRKLARLLRQIA